MADNWAVKTGNPCYLARTQPFADILVKYQPNFKNSGVKMLNETELEMLAKV